MYAWIIRIGAFEERLFHAVLLRRRRGLDLIMGGITRMGDPLFAILLGAALGFGLIPLPGSAGPVAALALVTSHVFVQILKRSVVRERPRLPVGIKSLIDAPDRFSFPSGHATAALAIAIPLGLAIPLAIGLPIIALGILVGASRCYLGLHYPGDVAVGWVLAIGSVLACREAIALMT